MRPKTFVILAAGQGTRIGRVGESLHKALVPLAGKAVLSHLLELAPANADIVLCVGHRHDQIMEYMRLAHPSISPKWVIVDNTAPGSGPGRTLYEARNMVTPGSDMIFTSCDTLWTKDMTLWNTGASWSAVAHIPPGTDPERWCRMRIDSSDYNDVVTGIKDKEPGGDGYDWWAYVGLSQIADEELPAFWNGIADGELIDNELQVSGGLKEVALDAKRIAWVDVGDEQSYRDAVLRYTGYDFTKLNEATYVLPDEGRVVKFWKDHRILDQRVRRGRQLAPAVPEIIDTGNSMMAYAFMPGRSVYSLADNEELPGTAMREVLTWASHYVWEPVTPPTDTRGACERFYREKTLTRIEMLKPHLKRRALDAVALIDWDLLYAGCEPHVIHGDFNFGNIVVNGGDSFYGIDWRENFGGEVGWGDRRYDLAKLMGGCIVHWDRAQRGDFRPWDRADENIDVLQKFLHAEGSTGVEIIAALSLLNSAPLHDEPLDEVLVARGTAWLTEVL